MSEKIIVVDDEDNIIGIEEREKVDKKNLKYRCSALWLKNSKGEVLLAKRALTKKHSPGKWGPAVAGTLAENETYEKNIEKEALEEIGIQIKNYKKGPKEKVEGKHKSFTQWFITYLDIPLKKFKIQKEEVAELKWISKEELKELLLKNPEDFITKMKEIYNILKDY